MDADRDPVALNATVSGRVQGVGFRDFVRRNANSLGLCGWVRNRADGTSVEVYVEGSPDCVNRLVDQLEFGPRGSNVSQVEVEWTEPQGHLKTFEIRS